MRDIAIATAQNLSYEQVEVWCNSLDASGFDGLKIVVGKNLTRDTVDRIISKKNSIFNSYEDENNTSVYVNRFYQYWNILNNFSPDNIRFVIATDITDVLFQKNPSIWLEKKLSLYQKNVIVASTEGIKYQHEPWNNRNMYAAFGSDIHSKHKDNVVYNAGVMAGYFEYMKDLFLNVYLISKGAPAYVDGGGGPDQAAYNIAINSSAYKNIVRFAPFSDAWTAQLGVSGPSQREKYGDNILELAFSLKDGMICNSAGKSFTIVHQYNRISDWASIKDKYVGV
jgi:hypothetical protein